MINGFSKKFDVQKTKKNLNVVDKLIEIKYIILSLIPTSVSQRQQQSLHHLT